MYLHLLRPKAPEPSPHPKLKIKLPQISPLGILDVIKRTKAADSTGRSSRERELIVKREDSEKQTSLQSSRISDALFR